MTSARISTRAIPLAAAAIFVALHLPYLPQSLEDVDSINFALGLHHFDVAHHQPHPPGYPLFIAAGKAMRAVVPADAAALAALSVIGAALGVVAIAAFARILLGPDAALVAALFAATTPLYWFTAARPLSDSLGLATAVGVQAMILAARTPAMFTAAAFLAGLAAGIRSQVLWLTIPLLLARFMFAPVTRHRALGTWLALVCGTLPWLVPLISFSGGPTAYWHALFDQGAEDLTGIRMLWTSPTPRTLAEALYYAFVAPWAMWTLAAGMLALAVVGAAILWRRQRSALAMVACAFLPYLLFDIVFQETFTVRYALPLVVPVALCAAVAVATMPRALAVPVALAVAMYGAHVGGRSIAAYSRQPAPVFRLLTDMRVAAPHGSAKPVLAPDRRASFDLRRPLAWLGPDAPLFEQQLASPPQHEWREAVKYWNGGGTRPVWFVVDPRRTAIDLIQHGDPSAYRYAMPFPALLSGTRPADMDWYRVESPEWYVGEGWALTPEAAGVADADRTGLVAGAIHGWARTSAVNSGTLVLGGRNFEPTVRPRLTAIVGGRAVVVEPLSPGPFVRVLRLPRDVSADDSRYVPVDLRSDPPARVGIEQFDLSASRAVVGFGNGWHEREFNPATGQLWRWISDRGALEYMTNGRAATLRITGESPRRYYSRASRLVIRAADRILSDSTLSDDFTIDVSVPQADTPATLTFETDQTHVPAEQGWRRSGDHRTLGLRIYSCAFLPATVSAPDTTANFQPAR